MPPIHTGMSVQVSLSDTVDMYLRQWLKVASGDRAILCRHTTGMSHSFTVFKCTTCSDNFHVGDENFMGTQIPQTLQDWVKKHRHVCSKFNGPGKTTGVCKSCGWPYPAHDESWMAKMPTVNDPGADLDDIDGPYPWKVKGTLVPVKAGKTLPEFTGRKFRDVED